MVVEKMQQDSGIQVMRRGYCWFPLGSRLTSGSLGESHVLRPGGIIAVGGAALASLAILLAPAIAASTQVQKKKPAGPSLGIGRFTPAVAHARLAARFARRGSRAAAEPRRRRPRDVGSGRHGDHADRL